MKRAYFCILFLFIFCSCTKNLTHKKQKYFEGHITYKNEYFLKTDRFNAAEIDSLLGSTADLYFKEGNYLEVYDKGFMLNQLYRKSDNKIYFTYNHIPDTLFWLDAGYPTRAPFKKEIHYNQEKVLSINCDELIFYYPNKTLSFYFNSDTLQINPAWYDKYKISNKNVSTTAMQSLYLKYKIEYPDYVVTVTATKINSTPIQNKIFEIIPGKNLKEDFYP